MKLAVIVARFQNSMPTIGHIMLIKHCQAKADKVIIVIGTSVTRLTFNNPLSGDIRMIMLEPYLNGNTLGTYWLQDHKYNNVLDSSSFHQYGSGTAV